MALELSLLYDIDHLDDAANLIYKHMPECSVITFEGELGAGKTTLIRALLKKCGVEQLVTSPTFTYVHCYEDQRGNTYYHFDLYRMHTLQEFLSAGFDEYLHMPKSWVLIEWPTIVWPLLQQHSVCSIKIEHKNMYQRNLYIVHEQNKI